MIRYRHQIELEWYNDLPRLKTDTGQTWNTAVPSGGINSISSWWSYQSGNELNHWQRDSLILGLGNASDCRPELYVPYRTGHGLNQRTDITLARIPRVKLWILSTAEHTWVQQEDYNMRFLVKDAIGPVTDPVVRDWIYQAECQIRGIAYRPRVMEIK